MATQKMVTVCIDYDAGKAYVPVGESLGPLELSMIWVGAANSIRHATGMEPQDLLDGMRELLAP